MTENVIYAVESEKDYLKRIIGRWFVFVSFLVMVFRWQSTSTMLFRTEIIPFENENILMRGDVGRNVTIINNKI